MRPLTFRILRELTHERFISGTLLAKKFGVTRSAISDALKDAEAAGINIFSVTSRGYQLAEPLALLNVNEIIAALPAAAKSIRVEVLDVIDSTNTALWQLSGNKRIENKYCLAAEVQTAGRGRRGRSWESAIGSSLTFSLRWRFACGVAGLAGLSLAVGLSLVRTLRENGVANAMVKWPNDILVDGMKLAGVLIESQGDTLGPTTAVIGIGLNVQLSDALRDQIDQAVCDYQSVSNMPLSRNALLARILGHLSVVLTQFERDGFAAMKREWQSVHALHSKPVRVLQSDGTTLDATVKEVSNDGVLVVLYKGRELKLNSAEISLRG